MNWIGFDDINDSVDYRLFNLESRKSHWKLKLMIKIFYINLIQLKIGKMIGKICK